MIQIKESEISRAIQITGFETLKNNSDIICFDVICDSISYNKLRFEYDNTLEGCSDDSFIIGGIKFIHNPKLTAQSKMANGFWYSVKKDTEEKLISFCLN